MKKVVLCILDGFGIRESDHGNAINLASPSNFSMLWNKYPHSLLNASGTYVGLPDGQMGNSEVGHTNIGAGRIVYQSLELINKSITDNTLIDNDSLNKVIEHVNINNSRMHILGLFSDGGVHSHINHIINLSKICIEKGIQNLYYHIITDGRDTKPNVSYDYIKEIEALIDSSNINIKIATISGRYYAMDRDNRWDRINKAYDAIINGVGEKFNTASEVITTNYNNSIEDEFIVPAILDEDGMINDNDGVIWANFRPDRAKEILTAIFDKNFNEFETKKLDNVKLCTLMPVSVNTDYLIMFKNDVIEDTLGEYINRLGLSQLRIAETEKYAHVTYFFDGGVEKDLEKCNRILIPSKKVATYDLDPSMSANEITDKLLNELDNKDYNLVVLNYANPDMVGHTGVLNAAIDAINVVDKDLGRLYNYLQEKGYTLIIIADHGNAELMLDDDNNIITSHTTNKVPFIITDNKYKAINGNLSDVAPTILKVLDIEKPALMTGNVLIEENV